MPVHEAWVLGALIMLTGLILGNLAGQWWARSHPDGLECGENHDEIWRDGYEQGADDEAASFVPADVPRPDRAIVAENPSAGPGHTYAQLTALADRDELEALSEPLPPVDPDWHPKALARSEAWLADTRAELGLVAA